MKNNMWAYTYVDQDDFRLLEKPVPQLQAPQDALVR